MYYTQSFKGYTDNQQILSLSPKTFSPISHRPYDVASSGVAANDGGWERSATPQILHREVREPGLNGLLGKQMGGESCPKSSNLFFSATVANTTRSLVRCDEGAAPVNAIFVGIAK